MGCHRGHQLRQCHDRLALGGVACFGFVQGRGESIKLGDAALKPKVSTPSVTSWMVFVHGAQQIFVALRLGVLVHRADAVTDDPDTAKMFERGFGP